MDYRVAGQMVMAAEVEGCGSIIRVPDNTEAAILRALEVAPDGVIVPHVQSARERKHAIGCMKFPPYGIRSLNPFVRAGGYHVEKNFTKDQNDKTVAAILVEGIRGIRDIAKIADDPMLDLIYMGSYDISLALGVPGETNHPKVIKTLKDMTRTITRKKKVAGCMFHDKNDLKFFTGIGVKFLCYKVDTSIVFDEIQSVRKLL
jgi:4-hydroxy-2-oxoheptanedioate aldolase